MKNGIKTDFEELKLKLFAIQKKVQLNEIGKYQVADFDKEFYSEIGMNWADVCVTPNIPPKSLEPQFYPEPRYVITPFFDQVNWLFSQLLDVFAGIEGFGFWKVELFGRLGNMANRFKNKFPQHNAQELLSAIIHEAFCCLEELEDGIFESFAVAFGNEIVDDYLDKYDKTQFLSPEETLDYFTSKGVLPNE